MDRVLWVVTPCGLVKLPTFRGVYRQSRKSIVCVSCWGQVTKPARYFRVTAHTANEWSNIYCTWALISNTYLCKWQLNETTETLMEKCKLSRTQRRFPRRTAVISQWTLRCWKAWVTFWAAELKQEGFCFMEWANDWLSVMVNWERSVLACALKDSVLACAFKDSVIACTIKDSVIACALKDSVIACALKDSVIACAIKDSVLACALKDSASSHAVRNVFLTMFQ